MSDLTIRMPTSRERVCAWGKVVLVLVAMGCAALGCCVAFAILPYGGVYAVLLLSFAFARMLIVREHRNPTPRSNDMLSNLMVHVLTISPALMCLGYFTSRYITPKGPALDDFDRNVAAILLYALMLLLLSTPGFIAKSAIGLMFKRVSTIGTKT